MSPNLISHTRPKMAILVLAMMLSSGCISLVDDVVDDIDQTVDLIQGEYPMLNLPDRILTSPILQNYGQCSELLEDLQQSVYDEMLVSLDQQSYWHWVGNSWWRGGPVMLDGAAEEGAPMADFDSSSEGGNDGGSREGTYSETNNQESDVDEADFLKTDGYYIYMLNNNQLVIMGVPEFGDLTLESNTTMQGYPMQMMLEGDKLVIVSSISYWNLPSDHPLRSVMSEEITYTYTDSNGDEQSYSYTRYENLVKYTVVDVSDRSAPIVERELYIEGNYLTARLVDGTVRSVTNIYTDIQGLQTWVELPNNYWQIEDEDVRMDVWNTSLLETIENNAQLIAELTMEDFAPKIYEMTDTEFGLIQYPVTSDDCNEFAASADSTVRGMTTIMTMKLLGEEVDLEVDHITSRWAHVYASQNVLLLAEPAADWWWFWQNTGWDDATNIHAFDISDADSTVYLGSGRVNGTVQDQFSMSEYNGYIRIASTSDVWGRWWIVEDIDEAGEPVWTGPSNQVAVLDFDGIDTLEQIGIVDNIAPNERIWSARFVAEKGYLVTFENMDPLWVIDLSDPTNPNVLGELEIPGVSTYIHPVDEDTLLTIGIGPGEDGLGLDWSITQVSLFDVSNPEYPVLMDVQPLTPAYVDEQCEDIRSCGWSWSWSEASYEHKAFTYWAPENLLAVPLSTYRQTYDIVEENGEEYYHWNYEFISLLQLVNVDVENGSLSIHGAVNHSAFYDDDDGYWWGGQTNIRRSIFMGDYIYSFSGAGAAVHRTEDLEMIVELDLPGYEEPINYYYDEESEEPKDTDVDSEEAGTSSDGS